MKEYYIRFSVNLFLVIDEEFRMNIKPFQNAELILHPSKGTPNTGVIIVRNEKMRRNEAWNVAKEILIFILKDNPAADTLVIEEPEKEYSGGVRATVVKKFDINDIKSLRNRIQMKLGNWTLGRRIAKGGQAEVFALKENRKYVLKLFKVQKKRKEYNYVKQKIERCRREIESLNRLKSSENIIKIIDSGEEEDSENIYYYYVMERAEKTLARVVKDRVLPIDEIFDIYDQILNGVSSIHQYFIHRDLKPRNIYAWEKDSRVSRIKIGDFGISFLPEKDRVTLTAERVGPYYYMAPELEEGIVKDIDSRADFYSLGKILYFLLSGGKIFNREKFNEDKWNLGLIKDVRYFVFEPFFQKTIQPNIEERYKLVR